METKFEQTEKKQAEPMSDNEVMKYRNMLRMTVVISIVLFVAWFIFHNSILASFVCTALCLLTVTDSSKMMNARKEMQEHGMQKGNIVGCAVLSVVDMVMWVLSLIHMFVE